MTAPTGELELFYSYAHKDEKLRNELEKHLFHLKRQGLIIDWYDRDISAGTEWAYEIDSHLNSARVILLLISPDFIASEYCYSIEMTRAMERHEARETRVIPIILRPTDWRSLPFSKLQALPTNGRPITKWPSRDEALLDVARGIKEAIKKLPPPAQKQIESASNPGIVPLLLPILQEGQDQETNRAPAWNVPYKRNPLFTSREEILQQLHEMFTRPTEPSSHQPVILSGLGGMGKTQIAIEYAHRHREEYHDILWAKADSKEVLTSELASFATLLNLPGQQEHDQQYVLSTLKHWLEVHSHWLLILDNVENLKMVNEFLPAEPKGHILLTAQTRIIGGIAKRLDIEKMAPEEGALLLLRRVDLLPRNGSFESVSEKIRTQAIEIATMLDGLPLAIDQAGAYIEETGTSLHGYIDLYASRRAELLKTRGGLVSDHPSVTATISLSFEKVEQSNAASAELLRFLAFLHPDGIPDELLERGASQLGSLLQAVASDPLSLSKAIGQLLNYSMVRRNFDDATLTMHRLVQDVLKDSMDEMRQRQWAERVVRAANQVFPTVEFANWETCRQYLPHAQICSALIETWHFSFPEAARLLYQAGRYLHERGQYPDAVALILQSLTIRKQTLGTEHLEVAESLNELAELYREQGTFVRGEPLLERAIAIREQVLGPDHPDTAASLNTLARLYQEQGKYTEAELLYKRALAIVEQVLGPTHPKTAINLNDLATLYNQKGQPTEAEPLCKRALAIREQVLGPTHPDTAISLNNLALLYKERAKYTEAEPLYIRALAIREQVLGPTHPDTLSSLNNLALLYSDQEQYTEAESIMKRVLAIREQILGPIHPDTAYSLNNLATLYDDQGQFTEAELLYKRALAIFEQVLGPTHPDTLSSLNNLALLYSKQEQYTEAESIMKRVLAIREQILGPIHPDIIYSLNNLAGLYDDQSRYTEAEPLYKRALAILEQKSGPEHPIIVTVLTNYILLLRATNRKGRAAEMEALVNILRRKISKKTRSVERNKVIFT